MPGSPRQLFAKPAQRGAIARRYLLHECGVGLRKIALAFLLSGAAPRSSTAASEAFSPLNPQPPHFAAKANAIIHLIIAGAPS